MRITNNKKMGEIKYTNFPLFDIQRENPDTNKYTNLVFHIEEPTRLEKITSWTHW